MGKHAETGSLFYAALSLDGTSSHFSPRTTRPQDKRRVRCLLTDSSVGRDRQGVTWLVAISRRRRVLDQPGVIRKHVAGDGSGGVFITAIFTDILGLVARVLAIPRRASGMHWTASLIPETLRRWEGIGPRRNRGRHGAHPCATPCRKPVNGRRYAALRDGHAVQDADRFPFMRARRAAAARDASSAGTATPVPKL
jgi:hypothetical protein